MSGPPIQPTTYPARRRATNRSLARPAGLPSRHNQARTRVGDITLEAPGQIPGFAAFRAADTTKAPPKHHHNTTKTPPIDSGHKRHEPRSTVKLMKLTELKSSHVIIAA